MLLLNTHGSVTLHSVLLWGHLAVGKWGTTRAVPAGGIQGTSEVPLWSWLRAREAPAPVPGPLHTLLTLLAGRKHRQLSEVSLGNVML